MKREDVDPVSPVGFPPNVSTVSHQAAKMKMTMRNEDGKTAAGMVMVVMMVIMVMIRKPDDFEVEHDDRHEVVVTHIAYRSL